MTIIRTLKPKGSEGLSIEVLNDIYLENSNKNQTRANRGVKSVRTHISS